MHKDYVKHKGNQQTIFKSIRDNELSIYCSECWSFNFFNRKYFIVANEQFAKVKIYYFWSENKFKQ